jgi:hypothetical protein
MVDKMLVCGILFSYVSMQCTYGAEEGDFLGGYIDAESPIAAPSELPDGAAPEGGDPSAAAPSSTPESNVPVTWKYKPAAPRAQNPFRGNWFKKRILVQEARSTYDTIHTLVVDTWEPSFQAFLKTYEPALDTMKDRIAALGFDRARVDAVEQEQLQALVTQRSGEASRQVLAAKQEARKSAASLPEGVQAPEGTGRNEQEGAEAPESPELPEEIAHLLSDARGAFDTLHDVQVNVSEAINIVRQQQPLGDQYEKQAWKQYEAIDTAYDDIEAAQLHDAMLAAREHLEKLLGEYLQRQLVPYTQQLLQQFETTMSALEQTKDALKKFDIYLVPSEKPAPPPAPVVPAPQSWTAWLWSAVTWPLSYVWSLLVLVWNWCMSWFV